MVLVTTGNIRNGEKTHNGRCLHERVDEYDLINPYEDVIDAVTRSLRSFGGRNAVPCYGFGDQRCGDQAVFTFLQDQDCILGLSMERIQTRYREVVENVVMADSMSLAPIIHQGLASVIETGEFSVLLIIIASEIKRPNDMNPSELSESEKQTIDAITLASHFPLSIVVIGVGDGPWGCLNRYQEHLERRQFDNFHFVQYQANASNMSPNKRQAQFALHALSKLPDHYRAVQNFGLLRSGPFHSGHRIPSVEVYPCPSPPFVAPTNEVNLVQEPFHTLENPMTDANLSNSASSSPRQKIKLSLDQKRSNSPESEPYPHLYSIIGPKDLCTYDTEALKNELIRLQDEILCCICEERKKVIVFQCGHETCQPCSLAFHECPTCRQHISLRIKRYG